MRRLGVAVAAGLLIAGGAAIAGGSALLGDNDPIAVDNPAERSAVYAAAVLDLATAMESGNGEPWQVLYVLDHTCAAFVDIHASSCDPEPLSATFREELAHDLASYAPVEFVRSYGKVSKNGMVINGGAVVTLGPLRPAEDNEVSVPVVISVAGLFAEGVEYRVTRSGGGYDAEATDNRWIA
jgi:hypothetical protein